jgi:hypothetical protein
LNKHPHSICANSFINDCNGYVRNYAWIVGGFWKLASVPIIDLSLSSRLAIMPELHEKCFKTKQILDFLLFDTKNTSSKIRSFEQRYSVGIQQGIENFCCVLEQT